MSELRYIGHPFIDTGTSVATGMRGKRHPSELTYDDLEDVARELKRAYTRLKPVQNFISTIFLNSTFVQSKVSSEQKEAYADEVLFAFREDVPRLDVPCTFFPEKPAVAIAHRQHIPLLNGRDIGNFSAGGDPGIPVSGEALLAIHAMPLGCLRCGNLLAFHQLLDFASGEVGLNLVFARKALKHNREVIQMIETGAEGDFNYGKHPRTRFVHELLLMARQEALRRNVSLQNITGYFFSNYGPSPSLQMYQLNNSVLQFITAAEQYAPKAWARVLHSGWQRPKKEQDADFTEENTRRWRNDAYEALFNLPYAANSFLKRYLLRDGWHETAQENWSLISVFLRKVMQMEQERIDLYKELGERLANYLIQFEAPSLGFYYKFAREEDYRRFRSRIRAAEDKLIKAGQPPIFSYDEYVMAFEAPGDSYSIWRLARDLMAFRMREIIYDNRGQFNINELPDEDPSADEPITEEA